MQTVRYFDECQWQDAGDGLTFVFVYDSREQLAEVALRDAESKLWSFRVDVPEKFRVDGQAPAGVVYSAAGAKKVAEMILLNTIVVRS